MLTLITKLKEIIALWWSEFTLQTKLMAAATLVVSLVMSGLTFWTVHTIQQDARVHDTRFGSDLGLLLAANATPFIAEDDFQGLKRFSSRFFHSGFQKHRTAPVFFLSTWDSRSSHRT